MLPPWSASSWRRIERPWVFGHRGARASAPENTLRAFELAMRQGADGVELDLRLDGSDRVVVFHDATLRRLCGDPRAVEHLRASELDRARVDGEPIPLLSDVLAWARGQDMLLNLELKATAGRGLRLVERVLAALRAEPEVAQLALISSFHAGLLLRVRTAAPRLAVAWLVADPRSLADASYAGRLGAAAVHPCDVLVIPETLERWRTRGHAVNVWTVNDAGRARELDALGVDGIISDDPASVLSALDARQSSDSASG